MAANYKVMCHYISNLDDLEEYRMLYQERKSSALLVPQLLLVSYDKPVISYNKTWWIRKQTISWTQNVTIRQWIKQDNLF